MKLFMFLINKSYLILLSMNIIIIHNSLNICMKHRDSWITRTWRPLAFYVYAMICLTDFVMMPIYYEFTNTKLSSEESATIALKFKDPIVQSTIFQSLTNKRAWKPITLDYAGTLHLTFLGILGAAAWTRGQQLVVRENQPIQNNITQNDNINQQLPSPPLA